MLTINYRPDEPKVRLELAQRWCQSITHQLDQLWAIHLAKGQHEFHFPLDAELASSSRILGRICHPINFLEPQTTDRWIPDDIDIFSQFLTTDWLNFDPIRDYFSLRNCSVFRLVFIKPWPYVSDSTLMLKVCSKKVILKSLKSGTPGPKYMGLNFDSKVCWINISNVLPSNTLEAELWLWTCDT